MNELISILMFITVSLLTAFICILSANKEEVWYEILKE